MRHARLILATALAACGVGSGCVRTAGVDVVGTNGELVSVGVTYGSTTQADDVVLGPTGLEIDRVDTFLLAQSRVYLFRESLGGKGLDSQLGAIRTLRFPTPPSPTDLVDQSFPVTSEQAWSSLRVYDRGLCSIHIPYNFGLNGLFNGAVAAGIRSDPFHFRGVVTMTPARANNLGPIFQMVSAIESNDRLRYNSVISLAGTLNDDAGTPACYDPQIEFETVFAPNVALVTTDPTIPATPTCPAPAFAVPWSIPALTAESAAVEIREFCALEGPFEDSVRGNLLALLPPGFQTRASGLLRFSAADVGAPVQTCTCHSECAGNRIRGGGSACVGGFCDVAIDVDRVVMMPEGFDIVVAESSSDPQASILPAALALLDPIVVLGLRGAASCDPNRIPTIASDGSPRVFTVPAVFDPPSI